MSLCVYEYRLDRNEMQTIPVPEWARFLRIIEKDGVPTLFALIDPESPKLERVVHCYVTGRAIQDDASISYVGSTLRRGDALYRHWFIEVEAK